MVYPQVSVYWHENYVCFNLGCLHSRYRTSMPPLLSVLKWSTHSRGCSLNLMTYLNALIYRFEEQDITCNSGIHHQVFFFLLQDGWTALLCASQNGHSNVVMKLLAAGAHPDHQQNVRNVVSGLKWKYQTCVQCMSKYLDTNLINRLIMQGFQPRNPVIFAGRALWDWRDKTVERDLSQVKVDWVVYSLDSSHCTSLVAHHLLFPL